MTFSTLGLTEQLLRAVDASGYTSPTPIQQQAIPAIINGKDVLAAAQTGTGKTASFTLPLLQHLAGHPAAKKKHPRALVLTPTRELASQVQDSVKIYGKYLPLRSAALFGGVSIGRQISELNRGVDIIVATPGRLLDLFQQKAIQFEQIEMLVLDEADRMLDMGFIRDIKKILALLPAERQNMMFSATFSPEIRHLAGSMMNNPVEIDVAPRNTTVETVSQIIHPVDKAKKAELLAHLVRTENWYQVLVFKRTKHGADGLVRKLSRQGISAAAIHGNKSQGQRTRALDHFKRNKIQILVATDIASRGLDIDSLAHVVNFDLPDVPEDYVHRIGRTGRAGATGQAISLVCIDELKQLEDIERLTNQTINRVAVGGFEPQEALPNSTRSKTKPTTKKNKPDTPKKQKAADGNHEPNARRSKNKRQGVKRGSAQTAAPSTQPRKMAA